MGLFSSKPSRHRVMQYIPDRFQTLKDVEMALREAGLESSELILAVDFTKSNLTSGLETFGGRSLHALDPYTQNPYERALMAVIGALEGYDDDKRIPLFGFGDTYTTDRSVFAMNFNPTDPFAVYLDPLHAYRQIVPQVHDRLSGPTSFAPTIRKALEIIHSQPEPRYHILIIIADGQVSPGNVEETRQAIRDASHFPLSIVVIGVGDGPFGEMNLLDDHLKGRQFDNFQFVEFHKIEKRYKEHEFLPAFACAALQEIPDQYVSIASLGLLNRDGSRDHRS